MRLTAKSRILQAAVPLMLAALSSRVQAYVDLASTMGKVIADSKNISLMQVAAFDREKRVVVLKEIKPLKGGTIGDTLTHQVATTDQGIVPRAIMQWAEPGAQALVFSSGRTMIVCTGEAWYQEKLVGDAWKLGVDRPELTLTYYGSVGRLSAGVEQMLAGKDAVLTMIPHGVEKGASFDIALNRAAYRGLVKVQRLRANLKMPAVVFSVSNSPSYMLGMGPVDEQELPEVIKQLGSKDAALRTEAADDLRQMADVVGSAKTKPALEALTRLLTDEAPRVRFLAAAAILRITHQDAKSIEVLTKGLESPDPLVRRDAASAAAVTGSRGAPLVDKLATLLKEKDEATRVAGLQALATLGPVALAARDAIVPLLDSPDYMMDAADALGRLGPRAQPVPAAMIRMLSSDQPPVRLAALRGMSQIGGEEARPAAEYIARQVSTASEIEAYNMVIFLALLGPVAREPAKTIKSLPFPNPALPQATNWAMYADTTLPWQTGMGMAFGDVGNFIYSAYVDELGERLRPCALKLAPKLLDGSAGTVPDWGYRILNAAPEETVAIVAPHLADTTKVMRERAIVILGYMGPGAASAKGKLEAALNGAADDRERNLLGWAIREVARD